MPEQQTITIEELKAASTAAKKGRRKYGNQIVVIDGQKFHSKHEASHWAILCLLQKQGVIRDLQRQVPFEFIHDGQKIGRYTADMVYTRVTDGQRVVTDCKSGPTKRETSYRLRRRMMAVFFGITITEV